ncbi:MAG TPA: zf-HC2 domain-containing protein [Anaeromyxobacter sp.]|nr:zf-HC2 domain-containing protein [Anaeromyxobacter sp.]
MSDAFSDRLLDLAYGELSKREAREVEAHAASCEPCRAELARIRATRRVMATLPQEPAPERGERILIAAAGEAAEARRPRRLVPRWLLGGAVVAASLAVVAVVSVRVARLGPEREERSDLRAASRYATPPPPEREKAVALSAPDPGEARGDAHAVERPAAAEPRPGAAPPRVVGAPAAPRRREPSPAPAPAPRPADAYGSYASPPPPAVAQAAPEPEGGLADAGSSVADSGRYEQERAEGRAAAAAPRQERADAPLAVAAPRQKGAAPPAAAPRAAEPPPAVAAAPERAASRERSKSAAAPDARLGYTAAKREDAEPGEAPLRSGVRSFAGCEGEAVRRVEVDARGRVVRYVREGRIDGRRLRVDHAFGPDGRPAGVTVTDLDAPGAALDARALGLSLPASAEDARIDAPPRCGR